jgi:hypothetical protein
MYADVRNGRSILKTADEKRSMDEALEAIAAGLAFAAK